MAIRDRGRLALDDLVGGPGVVTLANVPGAERGADPMRAPWTWRS